MQPHDRWMVVVPIIAALLLSGCAGAPAGPTSKSEPARVEQVEEVAGTRSGEPSSASSDFSKVRVVLTEKAAERVAVQTTPVREEQVARKRTVGGSVFQPEGEATGGTRVLVLLRLSESDRSQVDRSQPALVKSLARNGQAAGLTARPVEAPAGDDPGDKAEALYYAVEGTGHGLRPGSPVLVEVPMSGGREPRKIVPFSTLIYDLSGQAWVYVNPEPLAYIRHRVTVDYIEGDLAVLSEGPPSGTQVVTVGAAELYGVESGVGGH